jgi:hypothetical protein
MAVELHSVLGISYRYESVAAIACSLEVTEAAKPEYDEMDEGSVKDSSFGFP